jgi:hypothetical protein
MVSLRDTAAPHRARVVGRKGGERARQARAQAGLDATGRVGYPPHPVTSPWAPLPRAGSFSGPEEKCQAPSRESGCWGRAENISSLRAYPRRARSSIYHRRDDEQTGRRRNGGQRDHGEDPPWSYHAKYVGAILGGSSKDGGSVGGSSRAAGSLSHCKPKYYVPPIYPVAIAPHM